MVAAVRQNVRGLTSPKDAVGYWVRLAGYSPAALMRILADSNVSISKPTAVRWVEATRSREGRNVS